MKCNLFKHGTGLLLASLFSLTTSAQLVQHERLLSFEAPEVPSFISSEKSELSITPEHYKDGTQALNWKFKPGGILSIQKDLQFEPKDPTGKDTYLSGFVVWIYNKKATDKLLNFEFLKDGKICSHFPMGLNFTGWRAAWVCYERDMQGTPEIGMNEIRIVAPDEAGELCIDHLLTAAKMDHRYQTADIQVPFVNAATTSHWLVVYKNSKIRPDIALEATVTPQQKKEIALLESRLREIIYQPSQLTDKTMQSIRKAYARYGITYNNKGEVKGMPLFFGRAVEAYERIVPNYNPNIFNDNHMELKEYFNLMNKIAIAYNNATEEKDKLELKKMFLAMYDHVTDQGVAYGSCLGNFTHYGYSFRGYYTSYFLMKDVLRDAGKLDDAEKGMRWYSIANEVFIKPNIWGLDMDSFNTTTTGRIASILMMEDSPEKVQYLKAFSRWINNGCLPADGLLGSFKPDGGAFHHCNNYPAYAVGGLDGATNMIYLLSRTSFAVSELGHNTVKNVLLAMRFYCNKLDFPWSMSGRHPDGKGKLVPMHYAMMALAGTPDKSQTIDKEMGNAYLRLVTNVKENEIDNPEYIPFVPSSREQAMKEKLQAENCIAEGNPQGNWNLGYGCTNIQRRDNWSAVARGHSRYFWASEHYRGVNIYGRYLAHGSLQLLTARNKYDDVSSKTSGWVEEGFDWGRIPGATAIHLPIEQLKAVVLNVDKYSGYEEMLYSDEAFAGGITQEKKNGAFGMKLHEHDKYNGSLRARKSYHFFDNKIICLGSDIENINNDYDTETTVFQLALLNKQDKSYWNNPIIGKNYWIDHINTGYYIPAIKGYDTAILETHYNQHSMSNEGKPTTGDWISLTINHGKAPQGRVYQYVILPQISKETMELFIKKPTYKVLQQNSKAHIVQDLNTNTTSYILFETPEVLPKGLIQHVDTTCLVMVHELDKKEAILTVSNPDLALYRGASDEKLDAQGKRIERSIYSRPWISNKSQEIPVRVTLKGRWNISENPACKVISCNKKATTLEFTCKDAASFEVKLTK